VAQITSAGISKLESNTKLEELHLSHTQVDDAVLKHLAAISALKSIDLSDTKVSVSGVETLCQNIKSLREVYLRGCPNIGPSDLVSLRKKFGGTQFFNRSMNDRDY
jgi:hypothetical protein